MLFINKFLLKKEIVKHDCHDLFNINKILMQCIFMQNYVVISNQTHIIFFI